MASHFLLSAKARTLTLATVLRMTDVDAEQTFAALRWPETDGKPMCPSCGCPICYLCRRPSGALRFRCKACRGDFSLTRGTLFAHHKLPLQAYLAAVVIFCNEVRGKSSRDLGVQYKTAFVLSHKLREAIATEMRGARLGAKNTTVEVDGGYVKPANHKENRRDRRLVKNQNGKGQCVVVICQRDGRTLPAALPSEAAALNHIRDRVAHETEAHADDANSWNDLHGRYMVKRIKPPARLQHERHLHEWGGELLLPNAPGWFLLDPYGGRVEAVLHRAEC